jgi:hypothetical protein
MAATSIRPLLAGDYLQFDYTNHRGVKKTRTVKYQSCEFGAHEWYPAPQLFLRCFDIERSMAVRTFAVANIDMATLKVLRGPAAALFLLPTDDPRN